MEHDNFTRTVAAMIAANDRHAWRRQLLAHLVRSAQRVGIAWSALAIAGIVLVLLPMNMRAA